MSARESWDVPLLAPGESERNMAHNARVFQREAEEEAHRLEIALDARNAALAWSGLNGVEGDSE